jgi:hypothetical protein
MSPETLNKSTVEQISPGESKSPGPKTSGKRKSSVEEMSCSEIEELKSKVIPSQKIGKMSRDVEEKVGTPQ